MQLPIHVESSDLARLAHKFCPCTLDRVAIAYLHTEPEDIDHFKTRYREDTDSVNRNILQTYIYKGHNRKVNKYTSFITTELTISQKKYSAVAHQ